MKKIYFALAALTLTTSGFAAEPTNHERYQQALELEREGNTEGAFLAYLSIPGAEHAAARLACPAPDESLAVLNIASNAPTPIVQLIRGDLLLEKGETNAALACYRAVAASVATDYQTGWAENRVPWNYYFVESTDPDNQLHEPFSWRIGSHRDNWLIRRFIDLGAMDDAEKEFARIWALHQHDAQPYAVLTPSITPQAPEQHLTFKPCVVYPNAHDVNALNFALDYAHFLQNQGKETEALNTLLAPLLMMDLDSPPNVKRPARSLTEVDIDTYPPKARSHPTSYYGRGFSLPMLREEYIQRAFAAYKQAGKKDEINVALQREIEGGNSATRLTLAPILMQQQDIEGSLALELAYILKAGFDHASATYRRGVVYETHQKLDKAAAKYEALLTMQPTADMNLPLIKRNNKQPSQRLFGPNWRNNESSWSRLLNAKVIPRLQRIYTAQGETGKLLALSLARFDLAPGSLADFDLVNAAEQQHAAADQQDTFDAWAEQRLQQETNQTHRANLYWVLGDPENTLAALTEGKSEYRISDWKRRFKEQHPEWYPALLKQALAANPSDSRTRLQLLDTLPDPLDPDAIADLELLLAPDAKNAFPHGKGNYNRTRFRGNIDLAHRLALLYEQEDRTDDLLALGKRVARGEKPFAKLETYKRNDYYFEKYIAADLEGILSLTLHYADFQTLEILAAAWEDLPDFPTKRQLARKQRGGFATESAPPIPWANLPEGVEAIVSNENILSLAADETYVYSGHPWGIAVYDHEGNPVVRVALGEEAKHIEICGGNVWVGSPLGLFRIEPGTWNVAHLRMDQDYPRPSSDHSERVSRNTVRALATDGNSLWISTHRDIRRFDTTNNTLRIFSKHELASRNQYAGCNRFYVEDDYLWAEGYHNLRRYHRNTGSWSAVEYKDKPIQLIGAVDDQFFGDVDLGQPLGHRPFLLNRDTLEVTILSIAGDAPKDLLNHGEFSHYGHRDGKPVFGPRSPRYLYEKSHGELILVDAEILRKETVREIPSELLSETIRRTGIYTWTAGSINKPYHAAHWVLLQLPNGACVLGGRHSNHPYNDRARTVDSGGLFFISTNDAPRRVSSRPAANTIASERVYSITRAADGKRIWLCGDAGISLLSCDRQVLENIQRAEGLSPGRVTHAITHDDETHFTLVAGGQVILSEGSPVFRPVPRAGTVPDSRDAKAGPNPLDTLVPLLGGKVFSTNDLTDATFICGTHGMIVYNGAPAPPPAPEELEIEVRLNETERLIVDATAMKIERTISLERLKELLNHKNPFVHAEALGSAAFSPTVLQAAEFPALLKPYLSAAEPRVRCTAAYALSKCNQNDAVILLFEALLTSPDKRLRGLAAIELCRRGILPPIEYLREILETDSYGNHPFRAASSIGVQVSIKYLIKPLAPLATTEVLALLLDAYPISYTAHGYTAQVFPQLGAALLRHPEAAEILLTAYDTREYSHRRRDFSMHMFQFAGTNMLETLHAALKSEDRVVRSNAARACGAIGDPSSIEPLLAAWDLPNGLSRASIAWALGELNAIEAVPLLGNAYFITRAEEKCRSGPGQSLFAPQPQRIVRKNPKPYHIKQDEATRNEEHISSSGVLRAIEKIDPAAAETFYQTLAADSDSNAREAAAEQLVLAPAHEKNIAILRSLLADQHRGVQQTAAASLLILGDTHAESYFLEWLAAENHYSRNGALRELARIESPQTLAFARPALEKIAASNPSGYSEARYEPKHAKELLAKTAAPEQP